MLEGMKEWIEIREDFSPPPKSTHIFPKHADDHCASNRKEASSKWSGMDIQTNQCLNQLQPEQGNDNRFFLPPSVARSTSEMATLKRKLEMVTFTAA